MRVERLIGQERDHARITEGNQRGNSKNTAIISQTILGKVHMFYEMWCIQKLRDRGLKKDWLIFIKVAVVA